MSYLARHVLLLAAVLLASACAGPRANVRVLGVQQGASADVAVADEVLVVFVQVENPTSRDLELERLDYTLAADPFFATRGSVDIGRSVQASGSTVVEIAVGLSGADLEKAGESRLPYALTGTLIADAGSGTESRWRVEAKGALTAERASDGVRVVLVPGTFE